MNLFLYEVLARRRRDELLAEAAARRLLLAARRSRPRRSLRVAAGNAVRQAGLTMLALGDALAEPR
ncbi:MAG: hypothetical protein ACREQ5_19900 [Candidatus Dormibacteria bacterium]